MHVRREADIGTFTIQKWEKEGRQLSTCPQRKPCRSFLRRVGWGTDLCARIPFSFFFLTSQRLRFHLPLHTHPSIYRYLYFKLFAKLQQMGASRSGHFPTHHQRKAPPPLFFFCLKYILVPPTTVFLNSSSSKNVLKQTERFISKDHFPPSHTSGLGIPFPQIALFPDAPNPPSPRLPKPPRPYSLTLIGLISPAPGWPAQFPP